MTKKPNILAPNWPNACQKPKDSLTEKPRWGPGGPMPFTAYLVHYKVLTITANENRVFMEYLRQVDGEPDMKVAEVLEIKNEKIVFSRVYHGS
jgi:hypothetical protein